MYMEVCGGVWVAEICVWDGSQNSIFETQRYVNENTREFSFFLLLKIVFEKLCGAQCVHGRR